MPRKLFTAPNLGFLTGENARPLQWIFRALNEYFRKHIGFWGLVEGTTDANGLLVVTHECGFVPSAIILTHMNTAGSPAHSQGPFHIEAYDEHTFTIHCLTATSGNDDSNSFQEFFFLCLPETER